VAYAPNPNVSARSCHFGTAADLRVRPARQDPPARREDPVRIQSIVDAFILALLVAVYSATSFAKEEAEPMVIEAGRRVSVEYTLTVEGGEVADSNVGEAPLVYTQGGGEILPALEQALEGMAAGDSKQVELSVEDGYGTVRDELYETVEASAIPEEARRVGAELVAEAPDGRSRPVRVHEVNGDQIVIDMNHPLAGNALSFSIKVLKVE
jgi:FKBP-type peptidyl-prolyl cis-trans isomerase SlyD